jgi:chromosomal replication initiator protein
VPDHPVTQAPVLPSSEVTPLTPVYTESPGHGSALSSVFAPDNQTQSSLGAELYSRFNFSNYVMGESNEFAYKAALRVAEAPGLYFNPLFIYGRSGLGKTHLLLSIKNYINTYLLDKRVVYAPITEFINDFTNALAENRDLTNFKRKYHTCDVLLIDDVQNLEGKTGTTDALFEIFNMFIESRKQIVLSADRSPVDINIDERFTSRFAQGITADIQPPNYEMKTAILKKYKSYYCNFLNIPEVEFPDEVIQKIVELSGSNIRELEGAVSNLIVYVSYKPDGETITPLTYGDVESVLGNSFFHKNTRRVDFDMVIKAVESYFKISRDELRSEKRSKNISHPRQVAMYLIRRYTDMSYPEIGDVFKKDHTSVIYAVKNIQSKMVEEASVKTEVERIAEILTS